LSVGTEPVRLGIIGTGFIVTADLSRLTGVHKLYVYARSSVSGQETVISFPVAVGSR